MVGLSRLASDLYKIFIYLVRTLIHKTEFKVKYRHGIFLFYACFKQSVDDTAVTQHTLEILQAFIVSSSFFRARTVRLYFAVYSRLETFEASAGSENTAPAAITAVRKTETIFLMTDITYPFDWVRIILNSSSIRLSAPVSDR